MDLILRYPQDKADITGIIYEPWHYRYVGEEAAKIDIRIGSRWRNISWDNDQLQFTPYWSASARRVRMGAAVRCELRTAIMTKRNKGV